MTMKQLLLIFVLTLMPAACASQLQTEAGTPERAVEETFEAYRGAILASDGEGAAGLVTEATWDFYGNLAQQALTADRASLMNTHVADRITILMLRQDVPPGRLRAMTGREVFALAVDRGWISKDSAGRLRLTNYLVDGFDATAQVVGRDGKPTNLTMNFVKHQVNWRLDLSQTMGTARAAIKLVIALSGMSEEEFVANAVQHGTGRRPGPETWIPPL